MATTTVAPIPEAERLEMEAKISKLDDATLLDVMLSLIGEQSGGRTVSAAGRMTARIAFAEICLRWVPPAVFGEAFRRVIDGEGLDA